MTYRTRTYIAADFDNDKDAVDQLYKWNDSRSLSFIDAHELHSSRDDSLYCSIKASLKERMDASKRFVLIVGDHTNTITKGNCRYCNSYNGYASYCVRGRSVDYSSYIEYECQKAVEANIKIVVLYKNTKVDKSKCPQAVRNIGVHTPMICKKENELHWDYSSVKNAFEV